MVAIRSPVGCKYRRALRAKQTGSRVCFFRMAPSLDGERARQLANTLLGAKDGGHHHPKRTSALTSLRRQIRCCALATTISWFYELIDRQLATETVTQAQRRFRATQTRQHHCALLTMSSSIFGAEQRISGPLSALAVLTGRHREKKHPRPCFSQKSTSQRIQRVNDIGRMVYFIRVSHFFHNLTQ